MKKTPRQLGERKIIEIIQNHLDLMPNMPIPFGDDVSAFDLGNSNLAILKTDMLVGKTDVPPGMSLWQAARKAVVMNVSDFAAKGVRPLALLVSIGLPRGLSRKDVVEIGKGLNAGAREYGTYIVGGDTGEATDLTIAVSVFGTTRKGRVALRSGAQPGDVVAVTGHFGKTSAGLKILIDGLKARAGMREVLVDSVLMPHAKLNEGLALSRTGAVTAAIDSSDGLAWSLHEISRSSHVGFVLDKLPIAEEAESFAKLNKLEPLELALYGGEEYEIVLTINPELWEKSRQTLEKDGGELLRIGEATTRRQIILNVHGRRSAVEPRGFEHFAK